MPMDIYDSVNHDGLFDIQAKAFKALEVLNTARLTTIPTEVDDFLAQFALYSGATAGDWPATVEGVPGALVSWQGNETLASQIRSTLQNILIQWAKDQEAQPSWTITQALNYLIDYMETNAYTVDASAVSFTLTADSGNAGDVAICYTDKRGDGQVQANAYAENVDIEVTTDTTTANPTLRFRGKVREGSLLSQAWPRGSGCDVSITATDPANSLLSNGDMEDETYDDIPDDWVVHVGEPGTDVKLTAVEQQTVAITGTPTGGTYQLIYRDHSGVSRSTETLAYNASASSVQSALRSLPGLEQATVTATGTSPNYTHTIVFTGVAGNPYQLTSVNNLTGGSSPTISHATTVASTAGAYRGQALEFHSDGVVLPAVYHPLSLTSETVYFCHLRAASSAATTAGVSAGEIRLEIVDAIGGNVTDDTAGNANELAIDATTLTTTPTSHFFAFRLPQNITWPIYLRIRVSTAIEDGTTAPDISVYFDDVAVAAGTRLYAGGPYVAAFGGTSRSPKGDGWTLAVANTRGGSIQEWYHRIYDMASKDLLLPVSSVSTGAINIPDSLIA